MKTKVFVALLVALFFLFQTDTAQAQAGDFKFLFQKILKIGGTVKLDGIRNDPRNGRDMCFVHVEVPGDPPPTNSLVDAAADIIDVSSGDITAAGYVPSSGSYADGRYKMDFSVNSSFCNSKGGPFGNPDPIPSAPISPKMIRFVLTIGALFALVVIFLIWRSRHPNVATSETK